MGVIVKVEYRISKVRTPHWFARMSTDPAVDERADPIRRKDDFQREADYSII